MGTSLHDDDLFSTEAKTVFDSLLGIVQQTEENWLDDQIILCGTILAHADELKEWIAYVGTAEEAKAMGLRNVVDSYENGADHNTVLLSYKKALLQVLFPFTKLQKIPLLTVL